MAFINVEPEVLEYLKRSGRTPPHIKQGCHSTTSVHSKNRKPVLKSS